MGLAERRAIEDLKKGAYAAFVTQVKEITTLDIPVEPNWEEIGKQMEDRTEKAKDLLDYVEHMFFKPVLGALTAICADAMGREALTGAIKKIVFKCDGDSATSKLGLRFADGVVTLNMSFCDTEQYTVVDLPTALTELLESKL